MSNEMTVTFDPGQAQDVPVALDRKASSKLRARERAVERAECERLGLRILKLKAGTYRMLKQQIDEIGIKFINHCSIMISRDKAESVISDLDAIAKEMQESGRSTPEFGLELNRLKLECIKVMVDSGVEQLRAERQPSEQPSNGFLQMPFPAGTPVAVAVGQSQAKLPASVEEASAGG